MANPLSIAELKAELRARHIDISGMAEKSELVAALEAAKVEEAKQQALVGPIYQKLFGSGERTFLSDNKGNKVELSSLAGKIVGIYFSAHWCPPCRQFTPMLVEIYNSLKASGKPFEVVFVSSDHDANAFNNYFGTMPWLAVPYEEHQVARDLTAQMGVRGIPMLALLDENGKLISKEGRQLVLQTQYPFKG